MPWCDVAKGPNFLFPTRGPHRRLVPREPGLVVIPCYEANHSWIMASLWSELLSSSLRWRGRMATREGSQELCLRLEPKTIHARRWLCIVDPTRAGAPLI